MKELWVGLVELLTPPSEFGDTQCFTNVLVWAESSEDYAKTISRFLEQESMSVLGIEYCHPLAEYKEIPEPLVEFVEWAENHPDDWLTDDRNYYPSKPA